MFFKSIHKFQETIFYIVIIVTWILYFAIWFRLIENAPKYLSDLDFYVKIYVSLFLLLRFNPFRKIKFTNLDKQIAFSAGVFLFSTTYINVLLQKYAKTISKKLDKYSKR